jgi:hypothetical protein
LLSWLCKKRSVESIESAEYTRTPKQIRIGIKRKESMRLILFLLLVLLVIGALPAWPYSADWGYYPSGGLGLILAVVLLVVLLR